MIKMLKKLKDSRGSLSTVTSVTLGEVLYGVIAAVLFAVLLLISFRPRINFREKQPVDIVLFGDSVFGEIRDEEAIPARLQEMLGKSVYNGAFGGTCAARIEDQRPLDYTRGLFSLAELAKSVESGDFGAQQSVIMRESNTGYFAEVVDGLDAIDFSRVGIFVIQQGLNDYHAGVPIEDQEDPYDEYTFAGAVRSAVRFFRRVNPGARILIVTPTYTWYTMNGKTCEEIDNGGGILEDYVNAELRLAEELDLEVVDVYHDLYPHETWEDWQICSRDGLHPNETGRKMLAEKIAEALLRQGQTGRSR